MGSASSTASCLPAADGRYEIDATARFRALGVDFLVLVECKDHVRPIEREDVQILADRKRATGAQKAIFFATNGSGARLSTRRPTALPWFAFSKGR